MIPCAHHVAARNHAGVARCTGVAEPGQPCPHLDRHVTPACPGCGRSPWHELAVCRTDKPRRGCGYDARTGTRPTAKGARRG